MAQSKKQVADGYPLPVYNYRVTIGKVTLGFSDVTGLNVEYEAVTYYHGLSYATGFKIIPGKRQPIKITLKRGITSASDFLSSWFQNAYANPLKNAKQDILIDLCDANGLAVVRWSVLGALPVKLDAPAFAANSNEVAIETLELVAHEIRIVHNPK
ncbi:MAG: hypothetical protein RL748_2363 [Pseudomonadota bacterium]|jgi:phage tail-like protein